MKVRRLCGMPCDAVCLSRFLVMGEYGRPHSVWPASRYDNASLLCVGESQPLVHFGVCGLVRSQFHLWLSPRRVAVRRRRSRMVRGCDTTMVACKNVADEQHRLEKRNLLHFGRSIETVADPGLGDDRRRPHLRFRSQGRFRPRSGSEFQRGCCCSTRHQALAPPKRVRLLRLAHDCSTSLGHEASTLLRER